MADSMVTGLKRKKPPTFQQYPVHRAKKLKKAWVEKTKIKSKWKAQKKKEDLATSSKLDLPVYDEEEEEERDQDNTRSDGDDVELAVDVSGEQLRPHLHPSRAHIHPELPVKHSKPGIPELPPTKKKKILEDSQDVEPPSLRELKREAYSQSTLHTFKSDPLKKRDQGKRVGGSGGRGNRFIERGKGQPNMKLRMNVMLEKIKQDFS